ncbi:unnamed protein product [Didymodactylos carnosus]|uniref:Uncharacterized protein n=1 Tax=Didymodactylos carnosus TaxID=1234261 RepID=A0A814TQ22_9BILA|nr:unnamed protein product [Didymodactylos carnosus]CAF3928000.1 unnamed protein product [Didymodactylos carnosus]
MQQQQYFHRIDIDIPTMNYRDTGSSSAKYDNVQVVTVHQLKQIFDEFIQSPSFSSRHLIEILDVLDRIDDKELLTDAQLIDHKVYSIHIFIFHLCMAATLFDTDQLLPLVDALLAILDEKTLSLQENSSIIKYSLDLLRTLTNKNEAVLKYVQQRDDVFQSLKELHRDDNKSLLSDTRTPFWHRRDEENDIHEHEPLLRAIQENIRYFMKKSQAASLFNQYERSIRGLTSEPYRFDVLHTFKYVLFRTDYDKENAKRKMIEICRNYYRNKVVGLENIDKF